VAFAGDWNVADTVEFSPRVGTRLVSPDIVEPRDTVCTTKSNRNQQVIQLPKEKRTSKVCRPKLRRSDLYGQAAIDPVERPGLWSLAKALPSD
jgi:hypothetical protein